MFESINYGYNYYKIKNDKEELFIGIGFKGISLEKINKLKIIIFIKIIFFKT